MAQEYPDTVQDSTYIKTSSNIRNHILPVLGKSEDPSLASSNFKEVNVWSKQLKYMGANSKVL